VLSGCAHAGANFQKPYQLAISGNTLYATNNTGGVTICTISPDGSLPVCTQSAGTGAGIAASSGYAYIGIDSTTINVCAIVSGSLSGCTPTGGFFGPNGISVSGGYAYIANNNGTVSVCNAGTLSGCVVSPVGGQLTDVVISGSQAYVNDESSGGNILLCSVVAGGALANCQVANATPFSFAIQLAIH
jgi:hypothetical protein